MYFFLNFRNIELQGLNKTCKGKSLTQSESCILDFCPPDCEINGTLYQQNEKIHEEECIVRCGENQSFINNITGFDNKI